MITSQQMSDQELFEYLLRTSRELFPQETAKAESWLQAQAMKYGIVRGKEISQELFQNPWLWAAGGVILGLILKR